MTARQVDIREIVSRYAAGYFPLYDLWDRFYWERLPLRAIVPINAQTVHRAKIMARRAWKKIGPDAEIRHTTAVAEVIEHLQDEKVKEHSWVRDDVVRIYSALHAAGLLETVELWQGKRLIGALLGIVLPGTYVAETMFGLIPEASKVCLCRLVEDCPARGCEMIDVQMPHDLDELGMPRKTEGQTAHPCMRLGEQTVPLAVFMRSFHAAWKRNFEGGVDEWIALAASRKQQGR